MKFEIEVSALRRLIGATIRSISTDETREALNSLYLELGERTLTAVSSDGHRLAKFAVNVDGIEPGSCLISRYTVLDLQRAIKKLTVGIVSFDSSDRSIHVAPSNTTFIFSDRSDYEFPPYEQVMPTMDPEREGLRWMNLNASYLADAGAAFVDASEMSIKREPGLRIEFVGELEATRITNPHVPELVIVLMPMRLDGPGYPALKPAAKPAGVLRLVTKA